ncbi:WYL domain protein [Nitritalea halalkaliphila LW7]|uniref:WYL domain protein n=1 Tax=Nitritalea halalkaliphila LW7 TaxID=1189621 RepID=I5C3R7_9BACT|nr:WYL domain-containing protein [Nitritalea halalkaliphila]EIM76469.1 WYL domain protein [Nitritalea halalkaliphila LW7]
MVKATSIEQQKMLRVLQLIVLLQGPVGKPIHKLAESIGVEERTLYRYLKLLEVIGFRIIKQFGKYRIEEPLALVKGAETQFSGTEMELLRQAIEQQIPDAQQRKVLIAKLQLELDTVKSAKLLQQADYGRKVDLLSMCMRMGVRAKLEDYYSINSDSVSDRIIEPVCFTRPFDSIYALDTVDKRMKLFKLERITRVSVLDEDMEYQDLHERLEQDVFGFIGKGALPVTLRLSARACQLLQEEYPAVWPYLRRRKDGKGFLRLEVPDFRGIGRFILGLPGEITVLGGDELIAYLTEKVGSWHFVQGVHPKQAMDLEEEE